MARTHQRFSRVYADLAIHQLSGLSPVEMERLAADVKAARSNDRKDKALRSIARECRLWFKKQRNPVQKVYGHLISAQTGQSEKMVVATV